MRKKIVLFIGCLLCFTGCSQQEEDHGLEIEAMYVEAAQLTEDEKEIMKLLDPQMQYRVYDYKADESVESVCIKVKELDYGEWFEVASSSFQLSDAEGRLALIFEKIIDGCKISLQSEGASGAYAYEPEVSVREESVGIATSVLNNREELVYEKEIPLVMQVYSYNGEISSYGVEGYFKPEMYSSENYEHVYAVTIEFYSSEMS